MLSFKQFIAEGSARSGYTKRGEYAKDRETHVAAANSSEQSRGVKQDPDTDARSYSRTHTTPYNKGPSEHDADKANAEKLREPKKQTPVPTPVHPSNVSDRIADILNHPQFKKRKTGN